MRKIAIAMTVLALVATSSAFAMTAEEKQALFDDNGSVAANLGPYGPGLLGAVCFTEDITGVISFDFLGDPDNQVINADLNGSCDNVGDVGWAGVTLTTAGISWGQESVLQVAASDGSDASTIQFFPGAASSGTFGPTTGNLGSSVAVLSDLVLRMEFHEISYDDNSNSPDATYTAGAINLEGQVVPVELSEFAID